MTTRILAHCEPVTDALKAYGIDPTTTPQECTIEWTPSGILIDQYIPLTGEPGDVVINDGTQGQRPGPVTVKRFFQHPAPQDPWTTVPEHEVPPGTE